MRRLIWNHSGAFGLLLAVALALKLLVPAGFMPAVAQDGTITVQLCSGTQTGPMTMQIAIPGLGKEQGDHQAPAKAEMPCAFAGLAMPMLAGADPLLLATAIAFVLALGFSRSTVVPIARMAHLRPPLRGPPITA